MRADLTFGRAPDPGPAFTTAGASENAAWFIRAMIFSGELGPGDLADPAGMLLPDGSRGPTYTDAAIRTAVIQGLDPKGDKLAQPVPQWQITDQEWGALLAYLKTLH